MDVLKSLIIGWSAVWSTAMFVATKLRVDQNLTLAVLPLFDKRSILNFNTWTLYWLTPIYVFGVWAIGCILILSINWLITRRRK